MKSFLTEFYERKMKDTLDQNQLEVQKKALLKLANSPIEKNHNFLGLAGHKQSIDLDDQVEFGALASESRVTRDAPLKRKGKRRKPRQKEPEKRSHKKRKNQNKGNKQKKRFVLVPNTKYRKVDSCQDPKPKVILKAAKTEDRPAVNSLNNQLIREKNIFDFDLLDKESLQEPELDEKQSLENEGLGDKDERLNSSEGNDYLNFFQKEECGEQLKEERNEFKWPSEKIKEVEDPEGDLWNVWNKDSRVRRLSLSEEEEDFSLGKQEKDFLQQVSDTYSNGESDTSNGGFHLVSGELGGREKGFQLDQIQWGDQENLDMDSEVFGGRNKFKEGRTRQGSFIQKADEEIGGFRYLEKERRSSTEEDPRNKEYFQDGLSQLEKRLKQEKFGEMPEARPEEEALAKHPDLLTNGFQVPFQEIPRTFGQMQVQPDPTGGHDFPRSHVGLGSTQNPSQMGFQGYMNYPPMFGHQMNQNFNMMSMPNYSGNNYLRPMGPYSNISQSWGMIPKSLSPAPGDLMMSKSLSQGFDKSERLTGKFKFFNPENEFGFLIKDVDQSDLFFHLTDMENSGIVKEILTGEKSCLSPSFDCPHNREADSNKSVRVCFG